MAANSAQQSALTIEAFLQTVGQRHEKTAAETAKSKTAAEALSEAGSIGGETKHPVKSVDDRLEVAQEGARFKENTTDVKEDQGKPSVENAPEAKMASVLTRLAKKAESGPVSSPGSAADDQLQIGTNKQPTGEDPSNETSSVKGGKEDVSNGPHGAKKTTHPARTDNDQLAGGKYAADTPLTKFAEDMAKLGERICGNISVMMQNGYVQPTPGQQQVLQRAASPGTKQAAMVIDPAVAAQLGWEAPIVGLLNGTMDKAAADKMVEEELWAIVKEASDDADAVITVLHNAFAQANGIQKRAEGEMPVDPTMMGGTGGAAGGGGEGGGAGGPGGGPDESELMSMLGGGGGGGAGGGDPSAGGDPGGGGDPAAAMGGGGGEGGGGGGGPEVAEIAALMEQLGITPEEVAAHMSGGGAGGGGPMGGGGGGPMGGGGGAAPPPESAPPGGGGEEKLGAARGKPASVKTAGIDKQAIVDYLKELVSRSKK